MPESLTSEANGAIAIDRPFTFSFSFISLWIS